MRLYLARHGEAAPAAEDPEQPLTGKGRADVARMAAFLARGGVRVGRVIHSGRRRALQTALLLAEAVGPGRVVEEAESGLAPADATDLLAAAAAAFQGDTMVVGHQPFLGRLVARLVCGREERAVVALAPGTVVCLERTDDDAWIIAWMATPRLLGQ